MIGNKDDPVIAEVDKRLEKLFGGSDESPDSGKGESSMEVSPLWDLKAIILSIDWEITDEIMTRLTEQIGKAKNAYNEDKTILLFLQLLDSVGKYIKAKKADTHPDAIKLLNSVYTSLEKVALSKGISSAEKEKTLLFEIKRFKKLKEHIALQKAETGKRKEPPPPAPETEAVREEIVELMPEIMAEEVEALPRDEPADSRAPLEQAPFDDGLGTDILTQEEGMAVSPQEEVSQQDEAKDEEPPSEIGDVSPHEAFSQALMEIKRTIRAEFEALRTELKLWRQGQ